jgi:hypothetical protein
MVNRTRLVVFLALILIAPSSCLGASVYVLGNDLASGNGLFGTLDLGNGGFHQIGSDIPAIEASSGLAPGPNGSLLTLTGAGNLNSINPVTGVSTLIGPTGLGECSTPASPCGPNSVNWLGALGTSVYATDFANNLYKVNPLTGTATLIGPTGIPALPFVPLTTNPDGTFNAYGETIFGANGKLYATFAAFTVNPETITPESILVPPNLYEIDPTTAVATLIGPTDLTLGAVANVNGTLYGLLDSTNQVVTLDAANGNSSFVADFDPAIGIVVGASATPEPVSIALVGIGIAAIAVCGRRRRATP